MPYAPPPVKDRTRREHVARVTRVVFAEPTQPFVILALDDGHTAVGTADADRFDAGSGTRYRFLGRWEDGRRGPQFRFSTFLVSHPGGKLGVCRYLVEACDGIGQKAAHALYHEYGGSAIQVLKDDPARAAAECELAVDQCLTAAEQLRRDARFEHAKVELFDLFAGRGFHGTLIDACLTRWGQKSPGVIKRNPYALMGLPSAGFKRCDRLWSDLGLPPDSLKRQAICAVELVKQGGSGHTWRPAADLAGRLQELIPRADPVKAFRLGLRARKLAKVNHDGGTYLTTYTRAAAEAAVHRHVARLSAAGTRWPSDRVPVSRGDGDRLPSEHQVEQLRSGCRGPVGLFLGGPGTGKSHVAAYLLRELIAEFGGSAIAVCAPTGKAAVRARQALLAAGLDLPTRTIHSLLGIGRNGHDGDGWGFERNEDDPLDARFVLVDEASMIDTELMACLLAALADGTHVLFVGDPYQLPPVGHGAPLRDLIAGGVPAGELTRVRRNAGQIAHACLRIKNGESFDTCDRFDLDAEVPRNLRLIHAADEAGAVAVVEGLHRNLTKFDPVWQTQVIVARNKGGDLARAEMNDRLQRLLNPDGLAVKGNPFRLHDKIICTRNGRMHAVQSLTTFADPSWYTPVMSPDPVSGRPVPKKVYVANGEIGRVVALSATLTVARFGERDGLVKIPMGEPEERDGGEEHDGGRGCHFDLAYACTCHKLQGSEAPFVVVVADPDGGRIANREWWYTAVSRAAKACVIVGSRAVVDEQRTKQSVARRKTFLVERMKGAVS